MTLDFRTLVSFFAEFERQIEQDAPPGLMSTYPRDTSIERGLGRLFSGYSNCTFRVFKHDFTDGLARKIDLKNVQNVGITHYIQPAELGSLILNFDTYAEIYINDAQNGSGTNILNDCYRRFLFLKEVFHVVLRDEFMRHNLLHPDTQNPELLVTLLEELIYLPFSIIDFDNPEYSDAMKVEHAAELFAALFLYPLDRIAADRQNFLVGLNVPSMEHPIARTSSTLPYAKTQMMPRRYVDLLFRWKRFDELNALHRQLRRGY